MIRARAARARRPVRRRRSCSDPAGDHPGVRRPDFAGEEPGPFRSERASASRSGPVTVPTKPWPRAPPPRTPQPRVRRKQRKGSDSSSSSTTRRGSPCGAARGGPPHPPADRRAGRRPAERRPRCAYRTGPARRGAPAPPTIRRAPLPPGRASRCARRFVSERAAVARSGSGPGWPTSELATNSVLHAVRLAAARCGSGGRRGARLRRSPTPAGSRNRWPGRQLNAGPGQRARPLGGEPAL